MTNHNYNTPSQGAENWHEPLNRNFTDLDVDVEVRDAGPPTAGENDYNPEVGAKYLDTENGVVYVGVDVGDTEQNLQWVRQGTLPDGDGFANEVLSPFAVVVGGLDNRASGPRSAIVGGKSNLAAGRSSMAVGKRARAVHDGAVVFGDSTSSTVSSKSSGELRSQMPIYAPSFNTTSARAKKTDIEPFDPEDALNGVADLSIRSWRLAESDDGQHVGPMADEFNDAFDVGGEESIATVDADGVALAAIQALAAQADRREKRIAELEAENEHLRERLATIEDRLGESPPEGGGETNDESGADDSE
jgi:hypothetical protein